MRYMGGKARQAAHITPVILEAGAGCTSYLEPFIGSAWIFSRVAPHFGAAVGADIHPDLVLMWQAVLGGWVPPAELSREEYKALRHAEPSALRGFAGFGMSFGGKWFGGYAANTPGRADNCQAARRGVLKKAAGMVGSRVVQSDYREFSPGDGVLVYCDPPYAGTTGFSVSFDNDEFWTRTRDWADAGAIVLVSEYHAPDWAEQVWGRAAVQSLRKDSNTVPAIEKLFRVNPGA